MATMKRRVIEDAEILGLRDEDIRPFAEALYADGMTVRDVAPWDASTEAFRLYAERLGWDVSRALPAFGAVLDETFARQNDAWTRAVAAMLVMVALNVLAGFFAILLGQHDTNHLGAACAVVGGLVFLRWPMPRDSTFVRTTEVDLIVAGLLARRAAAFRANPHLSQIVGDA